MASLRCAVVILSHASRSADGPGHFQNPRVGPCAHAQPVHAVLEQVMPGRVNLAPLLDLPRFHLRIGKNFGIAESFGLDFPRAINPLADCLAFLTASLIAQLAVAHRRDLDVEINPIQQRAGDAGTVEVHLPRGAPAIVHGIAQVAAGAGLRCHFAKSP